MTSESNKLFNPPSITFPIQLGIDQYFDYYRDKCSELVASTRLDLQHGRDKIIAANSPFELAPTHPSSSARVGVLLIHGLLGSPFYMRDIAQVLCNAGYLTRSILLPGHGLVPGALLDVDYLQWQACVQAQTELLAREVDKIILIGFSTGANLALYQALQHPDKIVGVTVIAPALRIHSRLAFASRWLPYLIPFKRHAQWFYRAPDEMVDYALYRSIPYHAIYQVYLTGQYLLHCKAPTVPLYMVLSADDMTIYSPAALHYFQQQSNPQNRLLLYTNNPEHYADTRIQTRPSAYPELRIKNFSHISMLFTPDNPHYGQAGDYPFVCSPDLPDNYTFGEFSNPRVVGEELLQKYNKYHIPLPQHRRLTYNPDFAYLSQNIVDFVKGCVKR